MSSDMFVFDESYYSSLATNLISPEEISGNFFTDPLSTLSDSSIDSFFHEFSDDHNNNNNNNNFQNTVEAQSIDQITQTNLFSISPPSQQLETLSLQQQQQQQQEQQQQQQSHLGSLVNVFSENYSVVSDTIKTEDFHMGFDYPPRNYTSYVLGSNNNNNNNYSNSYDGSESMLKFMQRSYSSNSFEGKPNFWFQPKFNPLLEVQNFQPEFDTSLSNGQIRRVCSTGDLPVGRVCSSASPLSGVGEENMMEESNFKVGKYSAEERKERIDRYRAKRTQRNFNKTIKYACRKTLADNRPRIRGRFARNDETGEIPKPSCYNRYEDEDDLWVDNLQEEDEEGILGRGGGRFLSNFGATHHFQYCGY
ncbi:hypothetical protein BVRB_5g100260 isoform A [Beta vulgaris subsp. vulgaris]|nr:hypothetical protein BVRB_5g100260 isoform A [Beta vulgaris subsp. vulgaris]